jgi:hypothetical protein
VRRDEIDLVYRGGPDAVAAVIAAQAARIDELIARVRSSSGRSVVARGTVRCRRRAIRRMRVGPPVVTGQERTLSRSVVQVWGAHCESRWYLRGPFSAIWRPRFARNSGLAPELGRRRAQTCFALEAGMLVTIHCGGFGAPEHQAPHLRRFGSLAPRARPSACRR